MVTDTSTTSGLRVERPGRQEATRRPRDPGLAGTRIVVLGDGLVSGAGDPRAMGWVGRVSARTSREHGPVTLFPLGVPGESSADLLTRWQVEAARRFGPQAGTSRLVLGLGWEDLRQQVTLARSRLNLANIIDEAASGSLPVFVVGPPPALGEEFNGRLRELSVAYADVCERRGVPYVDTFGPLETHEDWLTDLAAGDGMHPSQAGYGLMAWLVLHGGWHEWLGLPEA